MKRECLKSGFTLVEVLITTAILGMVTVGFSRIVAGTLNANKHNEIKSDILQLRNYVTSGIDCDKTFVPSPPSCTPGAPDGYITVIRKAPTSATPPPNLIDMFVSTATSVSATGFGYYFLRAGCVTVAGVKQLSVEFKRAPAPSEAAFVDPLTKVQYEWRDLFAGLPPVCGGYPSGSTIGVILPRFITVKAAVLAGSVGATCGPLSGTTSTGSISARPWSGTVACPAGYRAIAAGAYVFSPALMTAAQWSYGGTLQASEPASTALSAFNETICVYTLNGVPKDTQAKDVLWATCGLAY